MKKNEVNSYKNIIIMDRLIIVVYVNTSRINSNEAPRIFERWGNILKDGLDDNDLLWFFPIREGDTRVEIINKPVLVVDEDYKKEIDNKYKELEDKILKKIDNDSIKD